MTYQLVAFSARRKLDHDSAGSLLADPELRVAQLVPHSRVRNFVEDLTARWPDRPWVSEEPGDGGWDSPWAGRLEYDDRYVVGSVVWSAVEEMERFWFTAAIRHGLWAYNPQTSVIAGPGYVNDHQLWLGVEHESAHYGGPWIAKEGGSLAGEMCNHILSTHVRGVKRLPEKNPRFSFPINEDIEGRIAAVIVSSGSRCFDVKFKIGLASLKVEQVLYELGGLAPFSLAYYPGKLRSFELDADDIDQASLEVALAEMQMAIEWAAKTSDIAGALEVAGKRPWTNSYLVGLLLMGRTEEALPFVRRLAHRVFSRGSDEDGLFFTRLLDRFDLSLD